MVIYLMLTTLVIYSCAKRKSKLDFLILALMIFILFGFSTGLADENIYMDRFYSYNNGYYSVNTEPLFTLLMKALNQMGMTYEIWKVILAAFYTISACTISIKLSNGNYTIPLVGLLLFPLCMDAVQQRQTLAMIIGWIAVYYLFTADNSRKKYLIYILLIAIASMLHFAAVFYLLILFVPLIDKTRLFVLTFIFVICLIMFGPALLNFIISQISGVAGTKILQVITYSRNNYSLATQLHTIRRMIVIFLSYQVPYLYAKYLAGREITRFQTFTLKMNIALLMTIPLIFYSDDFYRVQQIVLLFDYCAVASWLLPAEYKTIRKSNCVLVGLILAFAIINLYTLVLSNGNMTVVFKPFFENNTLF